MQIDVDIEYYSVEIRQFTSSDPVKVDVHWFPGQTCIR